MAAVVGILAAIGLALSVVSAGMNAKTIYEIETDRSYVAAADKLLRETRAKVESQLAAARARGDAVAVAEAEALRDSLRLVERRSNVAAIGRQVEQTKESFREEQWRQFQADLVLKGISAGAGRIGFGKVRDSYIRGTNWPPDPSKSLVVFDPDAGRAVRIALESGRPSFDAIRFEDELEDALTVVLNGYDVLKGTAGSGGQPRTASDALGQIKEGLGRLQNVHGLPSVLGGYLATSLARQAQRDNPQISGLSPAEREAFLRDQACSRLRAMTARESDLQRSEVLKAAEQQLQCRQPSVSGPTRRTQPLVVASAVARLAQSRTTPSPATRSALPTLRPGVTAQATAVPTAGPTVAGSTVTPDTSWVEGVVADVRSALERGGVPPDVADLYIDDLRDCLLDGARSGLSRAEAISRCQSQVPEAQATSTPLDRDSIAVDGTFEIEPMTVGPFSLQWQPGRIHIAADTATAKAEGHLDGKYRVSGRVEFELLGSSRTADAAEDGAYQANPTGSFDPSSGALSMKGAIGGSSTLSYTRCESDGKSTECPAEETKQITGGSATLTGSVRPDGTGSGTITLTFEGLEAVMHGKWKSR